MIVPLGHFVSEGLITADRPLDRLVEELADEGVNALVLHKDYAHHVRLSRFVGASLGATGHSQNHEPDRVSA
jgi:2-amino-4,5-dihydroxy-6-oxo-7-(phosphonooxy)heptanoate synthase